MNANRSSTVLFALLLSLCAHPGRAQDSAVPSPIFLGTSLPQPPQQSSAWAAPADLPEPLISATRTLFEQGLADPRGGEYREISVAVGNPWSGDAGVIKTHGWVLPSADGAQKFSVCWNGLTYPTVSVGKKADLRKDILAVISTEEAAQTRQREQSPKTPYVHWTRNASSDAQTITTATFTPIKACLLLRLGEADLARRYWNAWDAGVGGNVVYGLPEKADPYLMLASDWSWSLFDRALTAHMRGDDELSTISARLLTAAAPQIESEAARRGYVLTDTSSYFPPVKSAYLLFLEPLPRLLADGERRLREGKRAPSLDDIKKIPNKKSRIAALIENLDQITARQWGQPGGVSLSGDLIGRALVAEGDDAVQPLIDTLAGDKRLTRSVGFGRDFHRSRYTLSVAAAAYEVITDILQTTEFGPLPAGDTAASRATAVQAYWDKYHALSLPQRWRRTLADDSAAPSQWLQATKNIITPCDVITRGGWVETSQRRHNLPPPASGEALRSETAPSISNLMARRVHDMIQTQEPNSSQQFYDVQNADQMALYFSAWDAKAATPSLKDQFAATRASSDRWRESISIYQNSQTLAQITMARVRGGDTDALADYGAWIKSATLKDLSPFDNSPILEPLWRCPHDPAMIDAAAYLFQDPKSLWVPLLQKREGFGGDVFENLLESPLLGVAPFRDVVLGMLADKSDAGKVGAGGPRPMNTLYVRSPDWPGKATQITIRRCDMTAWRLSHVSGMPDFQYEWPESKRDAA
ncbi:MAG: hypothetical protein JWQ02_2649, partial [Capsulimonas sp.]|nr:hypothetical protein [Capsulimonas sp.]